MSCLVIDSCRHIYPRARQIEVWLNRLLETMRATVRHTLGKAVHAYDERPREHWVFDFPAQVALTGTQIWWTAEVSAAFSKLEEGYDNALKDYYKKHVSIYYNVI
jgi:dynein heavy chain